MNACFLFPGQGAQYPGMGRDLWESSEGVKALFRTAAAGTGIDPERLLFEGTEDDLRATDKTQIAVTLVNLSAALVLAERGVRPAACAGFSLGEYAALTVAGVLQAEEVFPLVKLRGELMEKASRALDSTEESPGMAAVIGLPSAEAERIAAELSGVYPANFNSPVQTVVSGTASGLAAAEARFKEAGARRVIRLKVSGPFHSPLLEGAQEAFSRELERVEFRDPVLPLYSNVTGSLVRSGAEARSLCVSQIVSPVRWTDEEAALIREGYAPCLEVGPGTVLTGLWKAVSSGMPCLPAGTMEDIGKIPGIRA